MALKFAVSLTHDAMHGAGHVLLLVMVSSHGFPAILFSLNVVSVSNLVVEMVRALDIHIYHISHFYFCELGPLTVDQAGSLR